MFYQIEYVWICYCSTSYNGWVYYWRDPNCAEKTDYWYWKQLIWALRLICLTCINYVFYGRRFGDVTEWSNTQLFIASIGNNSTLIVVIISLLLLRPSVCNSIYCCHHGKWHANPSIFSSGFSLHWKIYWTFFIANNNADFEYAIALSITFYNNLYI